MRVRCRGADGPPPAARRRRRYRPSSQAEHLLHRIAPGGLVGEPQCGADGAAREDVAVFGAVAKLDPLALPGEDDLVIAGDRDRKSVVSGKSVSVRVDLGGRRIIKKKKKTQ